MDPDDQMAAKLLSQSVGHIGSALDELLCLEPDTDLIRIVIAQARQALEEFEQIYPRSKIADQGYPEQ